MYNKLDMNLMFGILNKKYYDLFHIFYMFSLLKKMK